MIYNTIVGGDYIMNVQGDNTDKKIQFASDCNEDIFMGRNRVVSPKNMQVYHYHDGCEIYYLYSGDRYYFIKDRTYHIKSGEFVLIRPYDIHGTANFEKHSYDRMLLNFKTDYPIDLSEATGDADPLEFFNKDIRVISLEPHNREFAELLLEKMFDAYCSDSPAQKAYLRVGLTQLLLFLKEHGIYSDEESEYMNSTHKMVSEITAYINKNYYEDITLSSISERFYISSWYFSKTFKKTAGTSFTEYLNNVRVKEARKLLDKTDMSIADVAETVGFKSNTHFDRVFKKITGKSPMEYKKAKK